jgi:hypothetical protein
LDKVIQKTVEPVILLHEHLYNSDIMYVVAEGIIMCDISSKKIFDALVILLATYFVYNIEYSKISKNIFNFLEMALMGVVSEKSSVSVTTFMNVLSNSN